VRIDPKLHSYSNISEMWKVELNEGKNSRLTNPVGSKSQWYSKGASFWAVPF